MFVTKKYHRGVVSELARQHQESLVLMSSGHQEKVSALEHHISDLRLLVFPIQTKEVPPQALESDAIISASDKPFTMNSEEYNKIMEGYREVDRLLSGNYDEEATQ